MHPILFIAAYLFLPVSSADSTLKALLRTNDQLLLTGNDAAWAKFTAPDFYYVDEENRVTSRSHFRNQLKPSPLDWDDPLQISTYDIRLAGSTTTVVYRADEKEHVLASTVDNQ